MSKKIASEDLTPAFGIHRSGPRMRIEARAAEAPRTTPGPGFYSLVDVVDDDIPTSRQVASKVAEDAKERGAPERVAPRLRYTLTIVEGPEAGRVVPITSDEAIVGRGSRSDVWIRHDGVSRSHARLAVRRGKLVIEDLGSANGTFVDGARVHQRVVVPDGGRIQLGGEVLLRVHLLEARESSSSQRLYVAALRDMLTGLLNRSASNDRLAEEVAYARRHGSPLWVLLLDVDRFKAINDTHGHAVGDEVLTAVGRALRQAVRAEDVVGRWGGEEFVVLARGIPAEGARALAERVRSAVEKLDVRSERGVHVPVTISVGVAGLAPGGDASTLVSAADVALYEAKHAGRNRVCFSTRP